MYFMDIRRCLVLAETEIMERFLSPAYLSVFRDFLNVFVSVLDNVLYSPCPFICLSVCLSVSVCLSLSVFLSMK